MNGQYRLGEAGCPTAQSRHQPSARTLTVAPLLIAVAFGAAHADVPRVGDIAACNQVAREGYRARTVSPTATDEAAADAARKARAAPGAAGQGTQSEDPQIHGMDAEGAKDSAYRAVYRVCMRMKGF